MYLRIMTLVIVLVMVGTACGGGDSISERISEEIVEEIAEQEGLENIEIDADDGTVTMEDDEGNTATFGGGDLPEDFPFPLPDEYEVMSSIVSESDGGKSFNAFLTIPASDADDALSMYKSFLDDEGLEQSTSEISSEGVEIHTIYAEGDGVVVSISLTVDEEDQTTLSLGWNSE